MGKTKRENTKNLRGGTGESKVGGSGGGRRGKIISHNSVRRIYILRKDQLRI